MHGSSSRRTIKTPYYLIEAANKLNAALQKDQALQSRKSIDRWKILIILIGFS
jgi:hypothetical protein